MQTGFDPDNPPDVPEGISDESMRDLPFALCVADAQLADIPLVYANRRFLKITGYERQAIIGRNCRFLQGEHTREADRSAIREALKAEEEICLDILNYRADGEEFVNG